MNVEEHISNILFNYLGCQLNEDLLKRIEYEVSSFLINELNKINYCELNFIKIKIIQNTEDSNLLNIQPDNLFTLMFIHTGEFPPKMFMPNNGIEKDEFEWKGFKYSFVYSEGLGQDVPRIENI